MTENNTPQNPAQQSGQPAVIPTGGVNPDNPFQTPGTNPQDPPQQYQQPQYAQPQQKLGDQAGMRMLLPVGRSGWAIAAGYLGLLSVTLILAPIAIIISIIAIISINKSQKTENKKHGMGRAVFGLIMGVLGTVVLVNFLITGSIF